MRRRSFSARARWSSIVRALERQLPALRPLVVGDRFEPAGRRPARVRDDDVDAAERFDRAVGEGLDPVRARHVGRNRHEIRVGFLPDGLRSILDRTGVSRADRDLASLSGERERSRPTESLARGGDKGDFASESQVHGAQSGRLVRRIRPGGLTRGRSLGPRQPVRSPGSCTSPSECRTFPWSRLPIRTGRWLRDGTPQRSSSVQPRGDGNRGGSRHRRSMRTDFESTH